MLITLSGVDGAGKTTTSERLALALAARGYPAEVARPEYHTCKSIESFCEAEFGSPTSFVTELDPQLYLHALMADWLHHKTTVLDHHHDRVLLCDRYVFDVFAQLIHYGADLAPALSLLRFFPRPDVTLLLTITPEEARHRIERRGTPERELESLENLHILQRAYRDVQQVLGWNPWVLAQGFEVDVLVAALIGLLDFTALSSHAPPNGARTGAGA
jgi:dTMP kinase